jgi:cytochrome P450
MQKKMPNHELSEMRCPASLEDVDLFSPGAQEHWYEAYEILHAEAPVQKIPGEGLAPGSDGYLLTKYEDIARVVRDPERFTPTITIPVQAIAPRVEQAYAEGREPDFPVQLTDMIVSMASLRPTAELYRAHRLELTDPWVGPGASRHAEMITQVADELIDGFGATGEVEFVSQFARPLPQIVMARVLGFPLEDLHRLEAWGSAMVVPFVYGRGHRNELPPERAAEQVPALTAFRDYLNAQIARKRREPGDDMTTFLTQVTYQALGRTLHDQEIRGVLYAMVLGGLETTQYALAEGARLLCEDPALLERLRADRAQVRAFVEETLRLRAPTQGLSTRATTRDEIFQGVPVPAGSLLHLRFGAGNVDAEQYACPHEVMLDRKRIGNHLAFSQGPRICPGAHLSRLEQQIAWNRLLDRFDRLDSAPGNDFLHQPGIMLGTRALKLQLGRVSETGSE